MSNDKHAYLILAHQDFEVLQYLLKALDDQRNDIYIHFDAKVDILPALNLKNAKLIILEQRLPVYWGHVNMIRAEYLLLEKAIATKNYSYYHLLSGVDMPLKSQNEIHSFFDSQKGKLFIGYAQEDRLKEIRSRVGTYQSFSRYFRNDGSIAYSLGKVFRYFNNGIQRIFRINRNKSLEFKLGPQWFSITEEFVEYLIKKKKYYLSVFNHTYCSDELFVQTACWNSVYKKDIYNIGNEFEGCVRAIQWKNGQLINWKFEDLQVLANSSACFARKFDKNELMLVKALYEQISSSKNKE